MGDTQECEHCEDSGVDEGTCDSWNGEGNVEYSNKTLHLV